MHPLVSVAQLHELLAESDPVPVILDVRYGGPTGVGGPEVYEEGHIPGAHYLDLDEILADPPTGGPGGRHPLPTPERFERGMRSVGVNADSMVVVYDGWNSIAAARAWWLLRHFGHRRVRVLDGGWGVWDGAVETGEPSDVPVGDFTVGPGASRTLDADLAADLSRTGILLDARPAARFRGEGETIDPVAGHIPGAVSFPALDLVDETGRFLPAEVLREKFAAAGVTAPGTAGAYCGSGVQACHAALAAAVAGVDDDLALYAGSWSDWITDPSRPIA